MTNLRTIIAVLIVSTTLVLLSQSARAETPSIIVQGLFKDKAVMVINGQQRFIKAGETSPEGVTLVSSNAKQAVVEVDGEQHILTLSQRIGAAYTEPEKKTVRLSRQHHGHFYGSGRFNGRMAQFLVDTGASAIALSSRTAEQLGIKYKRGNLTRVSTAQGTTNGYQVTLRSVEIGSIEVKNVGAIVLEGEYPLEILLGNTFLSKIEMKVDSGVMVLEADY